MISERQCHMLNLSGIVIWFLNFKQDLKASVHKLSSFLGKSLSQEIIEKIADHCVFKNMKQNKMSNYSLVPSEFFDQKKSEFLRKGKDRNFPSLIISIFYISYKATWRIRKTVVTIILCIPGIAGDWKNTLTAAQADRFDAVYEEKMKDVNFRFFWDWFCMWSLLDCDIAEFVQKCYRRTAKITSSHPAQFSLYSWLMTTFVILKELGSVRHSLV